MTAGWIACSTCCAEAPPRPLGSAARASRGDCRETPHVKRALHGQQTPLRCKAPFTLLERRMPRPESFRFRRYATELGAALLGYAALLVASLLTLRHAELASPWREAVSLAPMLAGVAVAWVILRALRRMDELQVRIQ